MTVSATAPASAAREADRSRVRAAGDRTAGAEETDESNSASVEADGERAVTVDRRLGGAPLTAACRGRPRWHGRAPMRTTSPRGPAGSLASPNAP